MTASIASKFSIRLPSNFDFLLMVWGIAAISVIYWLLRGYIEIENYWSSFWS